MRYQVARTGGIGGVKLSTEIDSDAQPMVGGLDVDRVLAQERLLGSSARPALPHAVDAYTYELTVDGKQFTISEASDPELCADLNRIMVAALSDQVPSVEAAAAAIGPGYQEDFLVGHTVPLPALNGRLSAIAAGPAHHLRFSVLQHTQRHLAIYTAHNVDGATTIDDGEIPREDPFRMDPQIDKGVQIDNERGYLNNPWDRGHLVRRESMHWGDFDTAVAADHETFFWTNIAPQHEDLHDDSWGKIERWLLDRIEGAPRRACIFTGPVFGLDDAAVQNDPGETEFLLPAGYWKVGAVGTGLGLRAAAFIAWHRDFGNNLPGEFIPTLDQVRVTTVEHLTGLDFGQLRTLDPLLPDSSPSLAGQDAKRPGRILGPGDILL